MIGKEEHTRRLQRDLGYAGVYIDLFINSPSY